MSSLLSDLPSKRLKILNNLLKLTTILALISLTFGGKWPKVLVEGFPTVILEDQQNNPLKSAETRPRSYSLLSSSFIGPQTTPLITKKVLEVTVTGYSSTPEETDDTPFITASGSVVKDGVIAANFLDFGTKVRFPQLFGDKIFIVEDRMHERFNEGRVDIWFPTKEQAKNFGIKTTLMEIVE